MLTLLRTGVCDFLVKKMNSLLANGPLSFKITIKTFSEVEKGLEDEESCPGDEKIKKSVRGEWCAYTAGWPLGGNLKESGERVSRGIGPAMP